MLGPLIVLCVIEGFTYSYSMSECTLLVSQFVWEARSFDTKLYLA